LRAAIRAGRWRRRQGNEDRPERIERRRTGIAIGRWDEDALAEAYRRHGGAVYALARRVVRGTGLAEEVAQEVFVRLWTTPDRFDPERGSLRPF
jgi:RNA polymerase sigma-70 factor (ECF subfamily)